VPGRSISQNADSDWFAGETVGGVFVGLQERKMPDGLTRPEGRGGGESDRLARCPGAQHTGLTNSSGGNRVWVPGGRLPLPGEESGWSCILPGRETIPKDRPS
jgi:hypothetical protein